jgi:hypothetical protein
MALAATAAPAADTAVSGRVAAPLWRSAVYTGSAPVAAVSVGYRGGHRGGYYRGGGGGWGWGWGVGLGLGTGLLLASPWYYPGVVVTQPSTVVIETPIQPNSQPNYQPGNAATAPPAPTASMRPEPIIYPRNGQSPQQLEADRQECNRWATTQAGAMTDSSIFLRAVDACMDGRGYTTK